MVGEFACGEEVDGDGSTVGNSVCGVVECGGLAWGGTLEGIFDPPVLPACGEALGEAPDPCLESVAHTMQHTSSNPGGQTISPRRS